ncbi:hypothetical protein HELRODRAFT_183348 [Helobdella robusta]|uniref:Uncharacterized protein n=1 Tax=Helobdella robusta TaxID=6412 RepID=T1FJH6_HELRO|nr:hypothetical protein HELRODRAFT_183348 [Helobdella robusta]ESO11243.1 hypothetical protein HELRODRAFT_183348 [Helobdella robusta]
MGNLIPRHCFLYVNDFVRCAEYCSVKLTLYGDKTVHIYYVDPIKSVTLVRGCSEYMEELAVTSYRTITYDAYKVLTNETRGNCVTSAEFKIKFPEIRHILTYRDLFDDWLSLLCNDVLTNRNFGNCVASVEFETKFPELRDKPEYKELFKEWNLCRCDYAIRRDN